MTRSQELIDLAIEALEDQRDPLDGAFLREHDVTAQELFDLADQMQLGLQVLKVLSKDMVSGGVVGRNAALIFAKAVQK